jgi:hypothetical protein
VTSCLVQAKSHRSTAEMSTALIHKLTSHVHNVKRHVDKVTNHVPSKDEVRKNLNVVKGQIDKVTNHVPSKDEVRKNLNVVKGQVHSIRKIQKLRAPLKSYLIGVGPIKIERSFYLIQECEFHERENPKSYNYVDKSFSDLPIRLQQRFLINLHSKIEKITNEDIDNAIEKKNQDLIKKYIRIMQIRNRTKT